MKERNNIKISLIIPVFNIEKYVYKCLCSVVEQTKMPDEVIIIIVVQLSRHKFNLFIMNRYM